MTNAQASVISYLEPDLRQVRARAGATAIFMSEAGSKVLTRTGTQ